MTAVYQDICRQFDLGDLIAVTEAGGTRNESFIFRTSLGKWLVRKRYSGYCDAERIAFDHSAVRYLADSGVPVAAPVAAFDGETYWRNDEECWEVYRFIDGRHLRDGNPLDIEALGKALWNFHNVGKAFAGRYDKISPRGETDPENLRERIERLERESPDTAEAVAPYRAALEKAAAELTWEDFTSLPQTLVHGDVQPANILMNSGKVAAFIDLDWMAWRPRIYDLGWAILCCVASHEKPIGEGDIWSLSQSPILDVQELQRFLKAYELLTPTEIKALAPQLILTWIHIRIGLALKAARDERKVFLSRQGGSSSLTTSQETEAWVRDLTKLLETSAIA